MSGIATAIIGGSIISGAMGSSASRGAARAQQQAADTATEEQRRQYDLARQDLAPWRNIGGQAINQLGSLYGFSSQPTSGTWSGQPVPGVAGGRALSWRDRYEPVDLGTNWMSGGGPAAEPGSSPLGGQPSGVAGAPGGMAGFFASPDYNFRREEGLRGIEQSAAARGGALSGNAMRGLTDYSSNLAAGEYGDWWNRLAGLAGVGQTATSDTAQLGANFANQAGANAMAAGNARASGIMGGANSWSNALNSGLNNYMLYRGGYFG